MTVITVPQFRTQFVEFSNTPPSDQQVNNGIQLMLAYLDQGYLSMPTGTLMQLYLTAHYVYIGLNQANADGSTAGQLNSASVGQISVGYNLNNSDLTSIQQFMNSTSYGQTFWTLYTKARFNAGYAFGMY